MNSIETDLNPVNPKPRLLSRYFIPSVQRNLLFAKLLLILLINSTFSGCHLVPLPFLDSAVSDVQNLFLKPDTASDKEPRQAIRVARPFTKRDVTLSASEPTTLLAALADSVHKGEDYVAYQSIQHSLSQLNEDSSQYFKEDFVAFQRGNSVLYFPRALALYDPIAGLSVNSGDRIAYTGIPQNDGIFPAQSTGNPRRTTVTFNGVIPDIQGTRMIKVSNVTQLTSKFLRGYLGDLPEFQKAVEEKRVDTLILTRVANGASYSYVWPMNQFAAQYAKLNGGASNNSGWVKPIQVFDGDVITLTRLDHYFIGLQR